MPFLAHLQPGYVYKSLCFAQLHIIGCLLMLANAFQKRLNFEALIMQRSVNEICILIFTSVHLLNMVLNPSFPCDFFLFRRTYYYTTMGKVQSKLLILDQAAMKTKEVCRKVKLM